VLQAHALRVEATRQVLLRGRQPARTGHTGPGALWASLVLAVVLLGAVILTIRIMTLLHQGH
jgi:hypothetical protein